MRRSHTLKTAALAVTLVAAAASPARATNVTEFPDNGSEQMARGGAWVARASDPLATVFNPAGLAGQSSRVTVQSNFTVEHTCMRRLKSARDTTYVSPNGASIDPLVDGSGHYPRVCQDIAPTINPQLAATWSVTPRLGIGLAFVGPSSGGQKQFPEFIASGNGSLEAPPTRYLLVKQAGIIAFPTLGVGYEIAPGLRLGGSFSWGFARLRLASAVMSLNTDNTTAQSDIRANLQVRDDFVPGFTLGGLYSVTPELDVAAWYKWSDAIRARGDIGTATNYYTRQNAGGDDRSVRYGDTIFPDCGTGLRTEACGAGRNARLTLPIPMEAKIGLRWHRPRALVAEGEAPNAPAPAARDPLASDVFDLEANLTWANNSAAETIAIRFPGDVTGKGILPVSGVQGGEVPPNADQIRGYKDVFGLRVGGDWNVVPDRLALRVGTFYETSAANPKYQHLDFNPSARFGLAAGATYRIRLGAGDTTSAIELMIGYGHVFFAAQRREDPNADGFPALAGTSCNKSDPVSPDRCADGSARYRSKWPVNLGTITNALNVFNVGASYRF